MAFRRAAFDRAGLLDPHTGRKAGTLLGQEVREWCIRARAAGVRGFYVPEMVVRHIIPASRLNKAYFRRWFYWRGISRAMLYEQVRPRHGSAGADDARLPHRAARLRRAALSVSQGADERRRAGSRRRSAATPSPRSTTSSGSGSSPASSGSAGDARCHRGGLTTSRRGASVSTLRAISIADCRDTPAPITPVDAPARPRDRRGCRRAATCSSRCGRRSTTPCSGRSPTRWRAEPDVHVWYTSEYAGSHRARSCRQDRFLTHAQVEWRRFDLYINGDPVGGGAAAPLRAPGQLLPRRRRQVRPRPARRTAARLRVPTTTSRSSIATGCCAISRPEIVTPRAGRARRLSRSSTRWRAGGYDGAGDPRVARAARPAADGALRADLLGGLVAAPRRRSDRRARSPAPASTSSSSCTIARSTPIRATTPASTGGRASRRSSGSSRRHACAFVGDRRRLAAARRRRLHGDRSQLGRVRVPRARSAADRLRRAGPAARGAHQPGEDRAAAQRRRPSCATPASSRAAARRRARRTRRTCRPPRRRVARRAVLRSRARHRARRAT